MHECMHLWLARGSSRPSAEGLGLRVLGFTGLLSNQGEKV